MYHFQFKTERDFKTAWDALSESMFTYGSSRYCRLSVFGESAMNVLKQFLDKNNIEYILK